VGNKSLEKDRAKPCHTLKTFFRENIDLLVYLPLPLPGPQLSVLPPHDKGTKNMGTKFIPKDVRVRVVDIIDRFNCDVLADDYRTYIARFKGNYLFLYRDDGGIKLVPSVGLDIPVI